jgi:hypothetical protein
MEQPNNRDFNESGEKRNNAGLIIVVLLLVISLGFNVYQYFASQKKEKALNEELVNTESLRANLAKQRDSLRISLDEYKGKVSKLDTVISQREKEIFQKAAEIDKLLKQNKISYNNYLKAKDEIEKWKYYAEKYLKEIQDHSEQNKKLAAENQNLQGQVTDKTKTIDKLTDVNVSLSNKVALAEQLKAQNIVVTGVKFRRNNKERETNRASQIEKLKICFDVPENRVAKEGNYDIYIQVLDPKGQTLSKEQLGSGVTNVYGEQTQYSSKQQIEYHNDAKNDCLYWGQEGLFEKGTYHIILYSNGYKMGEQSYIIK